MALMSRPDRRNPRVQSFLDDEEKLREQEQAGGSMLGSAENAPERAGAGVWDAYGAQGRAAMAMPEQRSAMAPAGPGGMAAPTAQRPPAPTNAAPGAAMGVQPRPDPFGRAAPPMGAPTFAPGFAERAAAAAPAAGGGAAMAGGAAAGGGVAAAAPWLALGGQLLSQGQQKREAKQAAREQINQQYASSLGANMQPVAAARAARDANDIEGTNYLEQLLPFFMRKRNMAGAV